MKHGRQVAILGMGMYPWGMYPDKDDPELASYAILAALKDAGLGWKDIQFMGAGCDTFRSSTGLHIGNRTAFAFGETGLPIINVCNACATGVFTLKVVRDEIALGMYDIGIALGAGKSPGGFFPLRPPATQAPLDIQILRWKIGMSNPGYWAMYMMRRMKEYGDDEELMASIKVKSSKSGAVNPYARYKREFTLEEVLNSPLVCYPLRLYEICATSQGSAAIILGSVEKAKQLGINPIITIEAAAVGSPLWGDSTLRLAEVSSRANEKAPYYSEGWVAARRAFEEAGMGPEDMDMAEIPDNSPWHELESFETDGFCKAGEAGKLVREGYTDYHGKLPVNMSGGMASFGEVTNAQGLQQVIDCAKQMRGNAPRQLEKKVKTAFCQTYGGQGNNSVAIIKC
ncbi:MAG: lipid-transfer protein [Chloroflexota bacterium]